MHTIHLSDVQQSGGSGNLVEAGERTQERLAEGETRLLPTRRKEFNALMVRWVLYNRRVSLERLRDEGKITKEAFKRLTWGY